MSASGGGLGGGRAGSGASYAAAERPGVSVVVPTHAGSLAWVGECFEGLRAQREVVPELIVVLDGPAPEVARLAQRVLPTARQLRLRTNQGFAVAATRGLRSARGRLVCLLNDDAVPEPDWLAALLAGAEEDPDAGSFASRVLRADDPSVIDSAGHGLTRWGEPFEIGAGLADGPDFDRSRRVFGAPASASAYRAELIRDCGGFDPGLGAYLEDVELSLRAQVLGFPCRYVPAARVRHRGSASYGWGTGDGRAEGLVARNRLRLLARSMPRETLRTGAGPAGLSILADLLLRAVRGDRAGAALRGTARGLAGLRDATKERGAALGARRVDAAWIRDILRASEADLVALCEAPGASAARRARGRLARALSSWLDRRDGLG